jgi:hypothetical protein
MKSIAVIAPVVGIVKSINDTIPDKSCHKQEVDGETE